MKAAFATKPKENKQAKPSPAQTAKAQESERLADSEFGAREGMPLFLQGSFLPGGGTSSGLAIGRPDDALEHEADRTAAQVMGLESESCHCGGTCDDCQQKQSYSIQRKPEASSSPVAEPRSYSGQLDLGQGHALSEQARAFYEPRIGHDLRDVRIHTGPQAEETSRELQARAFTVGRDVAFSSGWNPNSETGQRLLAHELTHVVQQSYGGFAEKIQREVQGDIRTFNITPNWAEALTDEELSQQIEIVQQQMQDYPAGTAEHDTAKDNLPVLVQLQAERGLGESREELKTSNQLVPRPAALPMEEGYLLTPLDGLPQEFVDSIPEGEITTVNFPIIEVDLSGGGSPLAQSPASPLSIGGQAQEQPFATAGDVVRGVGPGAFLGPLPYLRTYGFAAAGDSAIGIVAIGRAGTPGHFAFGHPLLAEGSAWGHTATYVRQGGKISVVRGFTVNSMVQAARLQGAILAGEASIPAAIANDVNLFTKAGAVSLEYRVASEVAEAYARGLPPPGPVQPGSGIPPRYTARPSVNVTGVCTQSNCVNWALQQVDEGLGGRVGPQSSSQGRLMQFIRSGEHPQVPAGTNPTAGGMSTGMKVLRWGGRLFLVAAIVSVPVETALAPEGQRARTFVGASGGLAGVLALGALGIKAGLACGPYAIVCSPVLAIGGGIIGAIGGRAVVEGIYDLFSGGSSIDWEPKPNYCGECPSCHCVPRPKSFFERYPELGPSSSSLLGERFPKPQQHQMSQEEMDAIMQWIGEY